jgi:hypothetical protein
MIHMTEEVAGTREPDQLLQDGLMKKSALGAHFRDESMAERLLQGQIAEVIELRDDGRVSVRFDNGRLLLGREAGSFCGLQSPG